MAYMTSWFTADGVPDNNMATNLSTAERKRNAKGNHDETGSTTKMDTGKGRLAFFLWWV